jgi:hypothetical protein
MCMCIYVYVYYITIVVTMVRVFGTSYFHVLGTDHGDHRPNMLHTASSADQKCLTASLALQTISHDPFEPEAPLADDAGDAVHLLPASSADWRTPE